MSLATLDFYFPFIIFVYGCLVTFVLSVPALVKVAEIRLPADMVQQLKAHRLLGVVSLIVGALWSLQNLWFKSL